MAKYGKKTQEEVKKEMEKYKEGGHKIKNRKQAIAIGLSKARKKGYKVPPPPKRKAKNGKKT